MDFNISGFRSIHYLNLYSASLSSHYIIAGDFNLDLLKYDRSTPVSNFLNLMYAYYFFPCTYKPARVVPGPRGTSILLIDNIFTNDVDHKINSGNLVTDLSDHFPKFDFN